MEYTIHVYYKIFNFIMFQIVKNLDTLTVNEVIKQLHKEQEGSNANTETLKLKPETSQV